MMIVAEAGREVQEENHEAKEVTPRIDKTIKKGRQAGMTAMRGLLRVWSMTMRVENVTTLEGETMTAPETAGEMIMTEEKVDVVTMMMIGGDRLLITRIDKRIQYPNVYPFKRHNSIVCSITASALFFVSYVHHYCHPSRQSMRRLATSAHASVLQASRQACCCCNVANAGPAIIAIREQRRTYALSRYRDSDRHGKAGE